MDASINELSTFPFLICNTSELKQVGVIEGLEGVDTGQ